MKESKRRIAIETSTDDRDVDVSSKEVENFLRKKQSELEEFLLEHGVEAIDSLSKIKNADDDWYGLNI